MGTGPTLRREAGTVTRDRRGGGWPATVLVLALLGTTAGAMVDDYRLQLRARDAEATVDALTRQWDEDILRRVHEERRRAERVPCVGPPLPAPNRSLQRLLLRFPQDPDSCRVPPAAPSPSDADVTVDPERRSGTSDQ